MYGFYLNWSSLIIFLILGLIGIWVAYSFLNKSGLYLFCILAIILCTSIINSSMFSLPIASRTAIIPIVYFAFVVCNNKFGKEETKKMFMFTLISSLAVFVFKFFEAIYYDVAAQTQCLLNWANLGVYISSIIALTASYMLTILISENLKFKNLKKFLTLAIYIAIASAIDSILYTTFAFASIVEFWKIIVIILINIILTASISLFLGYFEKYLNREPKPDFTTENNDKTAEEVVIEPSESENEIDKNQSSLFENKK